MKTTIKALTIFFLISLFGVTVNAQSGEWMNKPAEERAKILTEWMVEKLSLTAEQQPQAYEINLKYAEKGTELKESSAGRREKFQTIKEYNTAKDEELKAVFTDEQFTVYQDKKSELRQKIKENRKGGED